MGVFGIDLGTTYCCVAYVTNGSIRIVESADGGETTPSVVFIDNDNNVTVGRFAREISKSCQGGTLIERVKNYMGRDYTINVNGREYSPTVIASVILEQLAADMRATGQEPDGVVITCPAYFGDKERAATKAAGEAAGLKVLRLIDEPVAAVAAFAESRGEDFTGNVLVYDLGGGTFDTALVCVNVKGDDKHVEVISTSGNHQLGGKDWDARLAEYIADEFCTETGLSYDEIIQDPDVRIVLTDGVERAKIALTKRSSVNFTLSYAGERRTITITRDKFDELTADLLWQTAQLIHKMLAAISERGTALNIDEILLVGGSARMPQVAEMLENEFPDVELDYFNNLQDKCVAMGAALCASGIFVPDGAVMPNSVPAPRVTVSEKCTKSYGLLGVLPDGTELVGNIILKDTVKPAVGKRRFLTLSANQSAVNLRVFQNAAACDNASLQESEQIFFDEPVPITPGLPKNAPLTVQFCIDENGIISVSVTDETNNLVYGSTLRKLGSEDMDALNSQKALLRLAE